jgi:hypothetical protein
MLSVAMLSIVIMSVVAPSFDVRDFEQKNGAVTISRKAIGQMTIGQK